MAQDLLADVEQLQRSETVEVLAERFALLVKASGMTASASGMLTGPRGLSANPIHFRNWRADWLALYDERKYLAIDPLIRWPMVSGVADSWSAIYARFPARDPGHAVLKEARRFQYFEGFVTPVRTRDGSLGLVSVGGDRRAAFSEAEQLYLERLSVATLRKAEDLLGAEEPEIPASNLTMREREYVGLLRLGLTDEEIAKVMAISHATVRGHFNQARVKLGARNRAHLATKAIP